MPLIRTPQLQYVDTAGVPWRFAMAYFSLTGTTTPVEMFQNEEFTIPHADPVVADALGLFPPIHYDPSLGLIRCRIIPEGGDLENPPIDADPINEPVPVIPVAYYAPSFDVIGDPPTAAELFHGHAMGTNVIFPANLGLEGWAVTAPTADYNVLVKDETDVTLATITFAAGQHAPTGATADNLPLLAAQGTSLVFKDGSGGDVTLANFWWTMKGLIVDGFIS